MLFKPLRAHRRRWFCCRMHIRALALVLLLAAPAACQHARMPPPAAHDDAAMQMIVVTTADWDAVDARLQRYERASASDAWRPVGGPIAAAVGRTGLAWGTGIHPDPQVEGPAKREGDGKAPAGIYRLSSAFGYAAPAEVGWIRMPYVQS